jgi:hypothetical protein
MSRTGSLRPVQRAGSVLAATVALVACTGRGVLPPGTDAATDIAADHATDVPRPPTDTGLDVDQRTDQEIVAACVACHAAEGERWQHVSSHHLLFNCAVCHTQLLERPGVGHEDRPFCSHCHSESPHPDSAPCAQCHDPHGSANAFLLRETITLPGDAGTASVHVTRPEGASPEGFVRAGIPDGGGAGTGFCEVCHTTTVYYNRAGTGALHSAELCSTCHTHADGFHRPG